MKPENIMMHNNVLKISDFGFARFIEGDVNQPSNMTLKGTPLYLPPQIFDGGKLSSKFDIWSVGAILHELLFDGQLLLSDVNNLNALRKKLISFKEKPFVMPLSPRNPKLLKIITPMLQYEESDRISWDQIFQSEWFKMSPEEYLGVESPLVQQPALILPEKQVSLVVHIKNKLAFNTLYQTLFGLLDLPAYLKAKGNFGCLRAKCILMKCQINYLQEMNEQLNVESPIIQLENTGKSKIQCITTYFCLVNQEEDAKNGLSDQNQSLKEYILRLKSMAEKQLNFHLAVYKQHVQNISEMMKNAPTQGKFILELRLNEDVLKVFADTEPIELVLVKISQSLLITDTNEELREISQKAYYGMMMHQYLNSKDMNTQTLLNEMVELKDLRDIEEKWKWMRN